MGDHESMAMWQGYGGGPYGVAIRSAFGILDAVLPEKLTPTLETPIFLGRVRYLDHSSDTERVPNENNLYAPFLCKSVAYQHESEIRAVFADLPGGMGGTGRLGFFVPVDLSSLVDNVTISPLSPSWFHDVVQQTCQRFGFDFKITSSIVGASPIF